MNKFLRFLRGIAFLFVLAINHVTFSDERKPISIVGSSTLFPFLSYAAEEFGKFTSFYTPVIESIGSGPGFNLFCKGLGANTPDIAASSRAIKEAEKELCNSNKVTDIIELIIGYDAVVISNSKVHPVIDFTKDSLFSALSQYSVVNGDLVTNNTKLWSDINSRFPEVDIEIYGPNTNTGTYDFLVESIMLDSCMHNRYFVNSYEDVGKRKKECSKFREDGQYIRASANENIIIQKIERNSNAFGIFSFSFLVKNQEKIQGNKVAGVEPNYQNIKNGKYSLARPLYLYIKKDHISNKDLGLKEFIKEILDLKVMGEDGYFAELGFIPLPKEEFDNLKKYVEDLGIDL